MMLWLIKSADGIDVEFDSNTLVMGNLTEGLVVVNTSDLPSYPIQIVTNVGDLKHTYKVVRAKEVESYSVLETSLESIGEHISKNPQLDEIRHYLDLSQNRLKLAMVGLYRLDQACQYLEKASTVLKEKKDQNGQYSNGT